MVKELFIARHGHTRSETESREAGLDAPLSSKGIEETKALALHLAETGVHPDQFHTSPLLRTLQTTQILQKSLGGVIMPAPQLREVHFGMYEGGNQETLRAIAYGYDTEKMILAGGETVRTVENRLQDYIDTYLRGAPGTTIVVTHGMVASILTQMMLGLDRTFAAIQALRTGDATHLVLEDNLEIIQVSKNKFKGALEL